MNEKPFKIDKALKFSDKFHSQFTIRIVEWFLILKATVIG